MSNFKQVHIDVPIKMFEEFVQMLPGRGERAAYLRYMIARAIEGKKHKDCFYKQIVDKISTDWRIEHE